MAYRRIIPNYLKLPIAGYIPYVILHAIPDRFLIDGHEVNYRVLKTFIEHAGWEPDSNWVSYLRAELLELEVKTRYLISDNRVNQIDFYAEVEKTFEQIERQQSHVTSILTDLVLGSNPCPNVHYELTARDYRPNPFSRDFTAWITPIR